MHKRVQLAMVMIQLVRTCEAFRSGSGLMRLRSVSVTPSHVSRIQGIVDRFPEEDVGSDKQK